MLALVVVCSPPAPPPPAAAPKKKEKSKQKNNKSVSLKFSAARSLVRKVVEKINKPLNDFRAKKRAAAKNKRNAAIAAAAKASPAAKAKQSDRRLANFDRRVGYLNALVMAASLFEEYEQAAVDFAIAAEEDAKLFAVRRLFEKSERAAAKAEAEAGAELALSSFAVCAVFIRAERKKVAEEAAEARASVDMEAAVGAMVVRKERAAAKRDVVAAARRRTKAERKAGATLALSSARFLFVRAEKAAAAVEAELGAELALDAARTVFVRAARAAERRELVAAARRAFFRQCDAKEKQIRLSRLVFHDVELAQVETEQGQVQLTAREGFTVIFHMNFRNVQERGSAKIGRVINLQVFNRYHRFGETQMKTADLDIHAGLGSDVMLRD